MYPTKNGVSLLLIETTLRDELGEAFLDYSNSAVKEILSNIQKRYFIASDLAETWAIP
jgi:hypothetical protein